MRVLTSILLTTIISASSVTLTAQTIIIDSSRKSIDISGPFNGAELHLPAVKSQPSFPGGTKAWKDFLRSNINLSVPFSNKAIPGVYTVMIRFIVGSDGKLRSIGADSNCGYGLESEVIRIVKKSADWIAAETTSGKKVSFTVRTMVTFTVKPNDVLISF